MVYNSRFKKRGNTKTCRLNSNVPPKKNRKYRDN